MGSVRTTTMGCFYTIVLTMVSPALWGADFAGGTGQANDPYRIGTAEQLISIGTDPNLLDNHFILISDIDLDPNLPGGRVFNAAVIPGQFTGTLDGAGHVIENLATRSDGLFKHVMTGGNIQNLGLKDVQIDSPGEVVGALAGRNAGVIKDCWADGFVRGQAEVGGLVGCNDLGTIRRCRAAVSIWGRHESHSLGGLVGRNTGVLIDCHATGDVTAVTGGWHWGGWFGGLVGCMGITEEFEVVGDGMPRIIGCYATGRVSCGEENGDIGGLVGCCAEGLIQACYATGDVIGSSDTYAVGGLVGTNGWWSDYAGGLSAGRIVRCYATGRVSGGREWSELGGLAASNWGGTITDCFWDVETTGTTRSDQGGMGLTTEAMMNSRIYSLNRWGDDPNWVHDSGNDYPRLAWQGTPGEPIPTPVIDQLAGSGTEADPYAVSDINDLAFMSTASITWDKHFLLTSDLDANGIDVRRAGLRPRVDFAGSFDGNGHLIRNLTINFHDESESSAGLFKAIGIEGHVTALGLENVEITATTSSSDVLGPLAGTNSGTVSHCYATGVINGATIVSGTGHTLSVTSEVGGLIGRNEGTLSNCWADCTVRNGYMAGGLTGTNGQGATITASYAAGSVSGDDYLGGLVGRSAGDISESHATGNVSGNCRVGGLVGHMSGGAVTRCYATGSVQNGASHSVGGLIGDHWDGSILQCFATGDVSSVRSGWMIGGLVGSSGFSGRGTTMCNCYATGNVTGGEDNHRMGGLLGYGTACEIINCYALGDVQAGAGASDVGPLVGQGTESAAIANSYFLLPSDGGEPTSEIGVGLTNEEMRQQVSFFDWDFDAIWMICEDDSFPHLIWEDFVCGQ